MARPGEEQRGVGVRLGRAAAAHQAATGLSGRSRESREQAVGLGQEDRRAVGCNSHVHRASHVCEACVCPDLLPPGANDELTLPRRPSTRALDLGQRLPSPVASIFLLKSGSFPSQTDKL